MGEALEGLNLYKEALHPFEKAISLDPNYTDAYVSKGNALFNLKRHEEALAAYEQAIRLDPNNANFYAYKSAALAMLGGRDSEFQQAIEKAKKLLGNG